MGPLYWKHDILAAGPPGKLLVPFLELQVQGLGLVPTILGVLVALFQNLRYTVLLCWDGQCGPVSGASSDQLHLFLSDAGETRALSLLIQSNPEAVSSSAPSVTIP